MDLEQIDAPPGYTLLDTLGSGAMGVVFRATQQRLNREVALKVLHPSVRDQPDFVERMQREAQAMSRLSHPNLIRIFDAGVHNGLPYIAMELVRGRTLSDLIRDQPVPARRQADALLEGLLGGVGALHAAGLVHRDLKPGNVMIDSDGRAVVMDLGLVKDLSGDGTLLTKTGALIGTPAFLAPEVLSGQPVTPAADVWSLGCIYFNIHAGHAPFQAATLSTLIAKILSAELPDLDVTCPDLAPHRRKSLEQMVARAAAERPRNAMEAAALFSRSGRRAERAPADGPVSRGTGARPSRPSPAVLVPASDAGASSGRGWGRAAMAAVGIALVAGSLLALRPRPIAVVAEEVYRDLENGKMEAAQRLIRELRARAPEDAATLAVNALMLGLAGDDDAAERMLRRAEAIGPDEPLVAEELIALTQRQLRVEEVRARVTSGLARWPERPRLLRFAARERFTSWKLAEAEEAARKALAAAPDDILTQLLLAEVRARRGARAEALAIVERAQALDAGNGRAAKLKFQLLIEQGEPDTALAFVKRARVEFPDGGDLAFNFGLFLMGRGQTAAAEAELRFASERTPWSAYSAWGLGECLFSQNRDAEAETAARLALSRAAGFHPARRLLARLLERGKNVAGAERLMREGLTDARALNAARELADYLLQHQRLDEASAVLRPLLTFAPDVAAPLMLMAEITAQRGLPDEATALDARAAQLMPWSLDPVGRHVQRLVSVGRRDEAEAALKAAIAAFPDQPDVVALYAAHDVERGNLAEADLAVRTALVQHPGHAGLRRVAAQSAEQLARLADAEAQLRRAWNLTPCSLPIVTDLGELLRRQKRDADRRKFYGDAALACPQGNFVVPP